MLIPALIIGIIGILVGGVINALSDDLPQYRRPRLPHYPDDTPRPVSAWLGITAFLLGQRRAPSGSTLSWRYPLTEIATAGLMIMTFVIKNNDGVANNIQLVFWLAYMAIFVLITVIDLEHKLILFAVIIPSAILALIDPLVTPYINNEPDFQRALIGGAIGFGVFFLLYLGGYVYLYIVNSLQGRNITEVAFGYGDVMMATLSGLILGPERLFFAMFITVFLGAAGALLWLVSRRLSNSGFSMFTALPYGPYIVAGTIILMLFGAQVRGFFGY
jgi:leader peptidase (prepilin peptidase) / N-methyltransferase